MSDSILTDRCRERLASHTPAETLEMMRQQLLADQVRNAAMLKRRMDGDMSDMNFALDVDATYSHKKGFE